jgi:hypothetical protein
MKQHAASNKGSEILPFSPVLEVFFEFDFGGMLFSSDSQNGTCRKNFKSLRQLSRVYDTRGFSDQQHTIKEIMSRIKILEKVSRNLSKRNLIEK